MRIRNVIISIAALAAIAATMPFALRVAYAGGGCHKPMMSDAVTTDATLKGNCFEPTVIRIDAGASITWTNLDEARHMITGANGTWGSDEELGLNDQVTIRFDDSGVFPYFCWLHPGMVGAVVVGDGTPSDTVTNASISSQGLARGGDFAVLPDANAAILAPSSGDDLSHSTLALGASSIAIVAAAIAGAIGHARPWRRTGG